MLHQMTCPVFVEYTCVSQANRSSSAPEMSFESELSPFSWFSSYFMGRIFIFFHLRFSSPTLAGLFRIHRQQIAWITFRKVRAFLPSQGCYGLWKGYRRSVATRKIQQWKVTFLITWSFPQSCTRSTRITHSYPSCFRHATSFMSALAIGRMASAVFLAPP